MSASHPNRGRRSYSTVRGWLVKPAGRGQRVAADQPGEPVRTAKKSNRHRLLLAVAVALAAVGVLLYPLANNLVYDAQTAAQKRAFLSQEADYDYEALYQFLKAENQRLYQTRQAGLVDAFVFETAGIDLSRYGIADNRIGYIEIPAIDVDLPILLGANQANMRLGAVHLTQTSYPIGGVNSNAVIAAHRGETRTMFRNIHKIAIGDDIVIANFRERLTYRAVEIAIINPTEIDRITIQPGRDLITLLSCHPLGKNSQRYVVYAERVDG